MSYFEAKMHQVRFRLGLRPRPRWGSLQRSADPLAGFKEPTSKGWAGEGRGGDRGKGRERKGKWGKGKGGEETIPPQFLSHFKPWFRLRGVDCKRVELIGNKQTNWFIHWHTHTYTQLYTPVQMTSNERDVQSTSRCTSRSLTLPWLATSARHSYVPLSHRSTLFTRRPPVNSSYLSLLSAPAYHIHVLVSAAVN